MCSFWLNVSRGLFHLQWVAVMRKKSNPKETCGKIFQITFGNNPTHKLENMFAIFEKKVVNSFTLTVIYPRSANFKWNSPKVMT